MTSRYACRFLEEAARRAEHAPEFLRFRTALVKPCFVWPSSLTESFGPKVPANFEDH